MLDLTKCAMLIDFQIPEEERTKLMSITVLHLLVNKIVMIGKFPSIYIRCSIIVVRILSSALLTPILFPSLIHLLKRYNGSSVARRRKRITPTCTCVCIFHEYRIY